MVPEERLGQGAVPELSLADNALLSAWRHGRLVRRGLISQGHAHGFARRVIDAFNVMARGSAAEARSLSGGNLQKFILGREILQGPRLLVAAHPTWGVDAGSAAAIHQALLALRDEGAGVLIVSQDLAELYAVCDRIAVMVAGRLSPSQPVHAVTAEDMGLMMAGLFDVGPKTAEGAADGH